MLLFWWRKRTGHSCQEKLRSKRFRPMCELLEDRLAPALTVSSFTPTPTGALIQFSEAIDRSVLNLYGSLGAADATLTGNTTGPVQGSLVIDASATSATFLRTGTLLPADTYTLTLRSAADGFKDTLGGLLDGNGDGTPGDNYTTTFTVAPSSTVLVSVPDFSRGPGQMVNVPATGIGLPLTLSDAGGVTSVQLTLRYNPALLTIPWAAVGAGLPTGTTVTLNTSTVGSAVLSFTSPNPLASGPVTLIRLTAQVPAAATYGASHLLDITTLQVNGGAIPARDDDALAVAAYFGDTTGNAAYSSLDANRALRVAVGLDNGLDAYPLTDPVPIADITGNGILTTTDATRIQQAVVGLTRTEIPPIPVAGLPRLEVQGIQLVDGTGRNSSILPGKRRS